MEAFERERIEHALRKIKARLDQIFVLLLTQNTGHAIPTSISIGQIDSTGADQMITGITKGAANGSIFEADPNTPFPSGTVLTWKCDDPNMVLTPSTTNPLQVSATDPTSDTLSACNLSVSARFPQQGGVQPPDLPASAQVPLLGGSSTQLPTSIAINQIS